MCSRVRFRHPQFYGLVTALAALAKTYTDLDWEVINDVQGDVDAPYGDNGTWIMTRKTFFKKFRSINRCKRSTHCQNRIGGFRRHRVYD